MANKNSGIAVYYNGACPVCSREINHYRRVSREVRPKIKWRDVTQYPHALKRYKIDYETAKRRLHLVDEAGEIHAGMAAMAVMWDHVPGYAWAGRAARTPGLRIVSAVLYEHVVSRLLYRWANHRIARKSCAC